jgi:hypothetical protein
MWSPHSMQVANFSALTAWPDVEVCAMPGHKIAPIRITQHRLELNPAFIATWDSNPRVHFDATLVRVATDTGPGATARAT